MISKIVGGVLVLAVLAHSIPVFPRADEGRGPPLLWFRGRGSD